jgi:hypothetical protein
MVAVCQDAKTPGHSLERDGYRALIGIIESGQVDAVLVADLRNLSADKIVQEVIIRDLRDRGVAVISTLEEDVAVLEDPPADPERLLIRDVLHRVDEHRVRLAGLREPPTVIRVDEEDAAAEEDVLIELVPASEDEPSSGEVNRGS